MVPPFSVPWDGRIDLGILPAGLIGNVIVTKGAVPVEFGANAVAGVVDLQTRRGSAENGGGGFTGLAEGGTLGFTNMSGVATVADGSFNATLAGGFIKRKAQPVADLDALPFSQAASDRRTNTDLESLSVFAAIGKTFGAFEARLSVIHNDTERGIAPESDRNPNLFAPRYFRYPDISLTQVTLNTKLTLSENTDLIAVGYRQWFNQTIDNYRTISYTALRSRQEDDDDTLGGRLTLASKIGPVGVRVRGVVSDLRT